MIERLSGGQLTPTNETLASQNWNPGCLGAHTSFPYARNRSSLVRCASATGRDPTRSLSASQRSLSSARLPSSEGIEPVRRFPRRYRRSRRRRFASSVGIRPPRTFSIKFRYARRPRSPSSDGIVPLRLLAERLSTRRLARPPNSDGMLPLRALSERSSQSSLGRRPNSAGIDPLSSFPSRLSRRNPARFPSSDGIPPLSPLSFRSKASTRPSKPTETPNHSEGGSEVDQFELSFQPLPAVELYSAINAARSAETLSCAPSSQPLHIRAAAARKADAPRREARSLRETARAAAAAPSMARAPREPVDPLEPPFAQAPIRPGIIADWARRSESAWEGSRARPLAGA